MYLSGSVKVKDLKYKMMAVRYKVLDVNLWTTEAQYDEPSELSMLAKNRCLSRNS